MMTFLLALLTLIQLDVTITVAPVLESNGAVSVNGTTNLPDGTRLMIGG
jgi:hypothetical protein